MTETSLGVQGKLCQKVPAWQGSTNSFCWCRHGSVVQLWVAVAVGGIPTTWVLLEKAEENHTKMA